MTKADKVFVWCVALFGILFVVLDGGWTASVKTLTSGMYAVLWAICVFAIYFSIKTYVHLREEDLATVGKYEPMIEGFSPSAPAQWPGIVVTSAIVLIALSSLGFSIIRVVSRKKYLPSIEKTEEVQLLERGVEAVKSCRAFMVASAKRYEEARKDIESYNSSPPLRTDQEKTSFTQWRMGVVRRGDMRLYEQVYKQGFMEVRRLLIAKVPNAAEVSTDYEDPFNRAGVLGICVDLSRITEAYIEQQHAAEKISVEDRRRYLGQLRTIPTVK